MMQFVLYQWILAVSHHRIEEMLRPASRWSYISHDKISLHLSLGLFLPFYVSPIFLFLELIFLVTWENSFE